MVQAVTGKIEADVLNRNFSELDSKVENVEVGPGGHFNTEAELRAAYPNGSDRFFIVQNFTYWWKNGGWVKGDVFPAAEIKNKSVSNIKTNFSGTEIPQTFEYQIGTTPGGTGSGNTRVYTKNFFSIEVGDSIEITGGTTYEFSIFNNAGIGVSAWIKDTWVSTTSGLFYVAVRKGNNLGINESELTTIEQLVFKTTEKTVTNYKRLIQIVETNIDENKVISTFEKKYNDLLFENKITDESIVSYRDETIVKGAYLEHSLNNYNHLLNDDHLYVTVKLDIVDESVMFNPSYIMVRQRKGSIVVQNVESIYVGNGTYFVDFTLDTTLDSNNISFLIDNRKGLQDIKVQKSYISLNYLYNDIKLTRTGGGGNKTLYVSLSKGNNANSGETPETPLLTFQKAVDLGANKIFAERGEYTPQSITVNDRDIEIVAMGGNVFSINAPDRPKVIINNGVTKVSESIVDGLVTLGFTGNTRFNKVFISHELPPVSTGSRPSYNAGLWQNHLTWELDEKLEPVLTIAEVKAKAGSFTWDGQKIYINPFVTGETVTTYTICSDVEVGLTVKNAAKINLVDIVIKYSYSKNFSIVNCMEMYLSNCESKYTMLADGIQLDNSNGNLYTCQSHKARNDGFNIHHYGDTHFFNCEGHHNYDDGISHHDGCTGNITGSHFSNNGKAGIAPTYGSIINLYSNYCHDNLYGCLSAGQEGSAVREVRHFDNVFIKNTRSDYKIDEYYKVLSKNNIYKTIDGSVINLEVIT